MGWVRISEWGRRVRSHRATRSVFSLTLLFAIIYCALYLAVGPDLLPGGNAWSTLLIFLAAHVGGAACGVLGLPPLLGMLLAGLLLRNATPSLVAGLPPSWSATFRALALGTIFLRSGLELDLQMFRRVGPAAVRLLLLPGLVEALTTAGAAVGIFRMPPFWALTQGFVLKAVGPAVVIQTMFDLQKRGLGVNKGIPSIVVGAASFDDMVAISGYSLFSSLALAGVHPPPGQQGQAGQQAGGGHAAAGGGGGAAHPTGLAWSLLHGPLDISLGVVAGLAGAVPCAASRLWDSPLKRSAVVFATAMALLFALYRFEFRGGGALAALVLGMAVNVFWERGSLFFWGLGRRSGLTRGPQRGYAAEVEARVGLFWRVVAQPLLFGIIGSLVNLRTVSGDIIPKSIALIVIGMAVRIPTTFLAMAGAGLSTRERIFVAIAWTPKATVQAALGAQPLDMIRSAAGPDSPLMRVGHEILTTSVFAIIICANIGVSLIHYLAPRWLHRTVPQPKALGAAAAAAMPGGDGGGEAHGATTGDGGGDNSGGGGRGAAPPSGADAYGTGVAPGSGSSDSEDTGNGGRQRRGGNTDEDAAAAGGVSAPSLRLGPRGYNWAEESYSPTPRSISTPMGGELAAALSADDRERGGIWCRCGGGSDANTITVGKAAEKKADSIGVAAAAVTPLRRPGRPPLPPKAAVHAASMAAPRRSGSSGGASPAPAAAAVPYDGGDGAQGGVRAAGGTSSDTSSGDEGTGFVTCADGTGAVSPVAGGHDPGRHTPLATSFSAPLGAQPPGLRRCSRCRGLLPADTAEGGGGGGYRSDASLLPATQPRPPRRRISGHHGRPPRSRPNLFADGNDSDGAASATRGPAGGTAAELTSGASMTRRHSAPVTVIDVMETLDVLAVPPEALTPVRPPPPAGRAAAAAAAAAALAAIQMQVAELEAEAAGLAGLASRLAATHATGGAAAVATVPTPVAGEAGAATGVADGGGAAELAGRAAALQRMAAAVREQVAAAAAAGKSGGPDCGRGGGGGGWLSGEEADDEEGAEGDAGEEEPPTETARSFFRRAQEVEMVGSVVASGTEQAANGANMMGHGGGGVPGDDEAGVSGRIPGEERGLAV